MIFIINRIKDTRPLHFLVHMYREEGRKKKKHANDLTLIVHNPKHMSYIKWL